MTQNKVELAEKLSKESHQGQKYGPHDYFDYHIKGVVNSLIEHQFQKSILLQPFSTIVLKTPLLP